MCETARNGALPLHGSDPQAAATLHVPTSLQQAPAEPASSRKAGGGRPRLWDLPHKYHCPVIGTCLHVDELRRLGKKSGCMPTHELSDFEVHVSFVAAAESRNALSQAVQRTLERRYTAVVKRFARARAPADLEHLWREALANGEVQGAFWAVMSHPHAPPELRTRAYEDVHMLSHQIGAGLNADLKALAETRETLARVRRESAAAAARAERALAEKDARLAQAGQQLADLAGVETALEAARGRLAALESGAELKALRARVDAQDQEIAMLRQRAREHAAQVTGLERLLAGSEQRGSETAAELAEREASLRALVERCNGELVRHDGGLEDNRSRLESLLASADAVICPLDCVSHDASLRTKRFCKRYGTPCVMLKRSGVGAFALALSQLTAAARVPGQSEASARLIQA
ncbi:hypothetical protein CKO31_06775 [Thiohalocapsa halophila]|uniref:DUF2325 domain-containing protein n=1 Tax=Thiohalocapsa halophila TaxID=69359 RepID=A0ABS1CEW4_9GAMM|nr:DUF2325 domain-containing protein [Thiohalocapsa halophila]MBK1630452.1 hypothetical protein [Thiohalocapsa halophila]